MPLTKMKEEKKHNPTERTFKDLENCKDCRSQETSGGAGSRFSYDDSGLGGAGSSKGGQETSLKEEDGYENKHCPNCKLDFLGIGFDSKCPECETEFRSSAPSLEWEEQPVFPKQSWEEEFEKKVANGEFEITKPWRENNEVQILYGTIKSFIKKVESNALVRGREETLKEVEAKILATRDDNVAFMTMTNKTGEIDDWTLPVSEVLKILKDKPKGIQKN